MELWAVLLGAVKLRISGARPERFINLCVVHDFPLWQVRWQGEYVYLYMSLPDFFKIRPLVRRSGVRVKVVGRRGWPFLWRRIRERRLLIPAMAAAAIAVYVFSSCVWFFEVRGNESIDAQTILEQAHRAGLRRGAWRPAINRDAVAREMILGIPALAWVGLEFVGTKVIVEVVEKTLPPDMALAGPGDLVARRAGVIEDVLVLQGEAVVRPGDVVLAGETLILGRISAPAPWDETSSAQGETPPEHAKPVRARGRVMARTWYDSFLELSLEKTVAVFTGRIAVQRLLRVGGREVVIYGPRKAPFKYYRQRSHAVSITPWAPGNEGVSLVTLTMEEYEPVKRRIDPASGRKELERRLKARLMQEIPAGARIVTVDFQDVGQSPTMVTGRMRIEVVEDIAEFKPASD